MLLWSHLKLCPIAKIKKGKDLKKNAARQKRQIWRLKRKLAATQAEEQNHGGPNDSLKPGEKNFAKKLKKRKMKEGERKMIRAKKGN